MYKYCKFLVQSKQEGKERNFLNTGDDLISTGLSIKDIVSCKK